MGIILELSHPIVWLVRHVCSNKAEFSFLQKKTAFWCSFKHLPNWRLVCLMYSLSQSLQVMVHCSFVTGSFGSAKICPKVWNLTPPFWARLITVIIIFILKEKNYHKKINSPFSIQEFDFIYSIFFRVCILWLQMMHNRKLFWLEIMKLIKELVSYENEY